MFHSCHGLMNSINWPASSVWVFIAQLVVHCSANAGATGLNPVEAPKNLFFGLFRNCLNCDSTAMVTYLFLFHWRSSHHFILHVNTTHQCKTVHMNGSMASCSIPCRSPRWYRTCNTHHPPLCHILQEQDLLRYTRLY